MTALVDKKCCGCLLFLLQVWSSASEYHYNCNSPSLVALSLTAADFLSIKASMCSKCGASQCTHSFHGYFAWKLFLGLTLKAPFFFLAFPFRVDQPQIHDLWLLQTRNATPLELTDFLPQPVFDGGVSQSASIAIFKSEKSDTFSIPFSLEKAE